MDAATLAFRSPSSLPNSRALSVPSPVRDAGYEIFVTTEHNHDDQPANQGNIDQPKND